MARWLVAGGLLGSSSWAKRGADARHARVRSAFVIPLVATLLYFGLLAVVIAFLVNQALNNSPLTLDWSLPYAPAALWAILLVPA